MINLCLPWAALGKLSEGLSDSTGKLLFVSYPLYSPLLTF